MMQAHGLSSSLQRKMSNEMKDYLYDKIGEIVLDSSTMDKIEEIYPASYFSHNYVHGWKNGQRVVLEVWFDDDTGDWKIEHRETDK